MLYAAVFGALDVIIILNLASSRLRVLERLFVIWVSIITFGYLHKLFINRSEISAVVYHSVLPSVASQNAVLIAVGIIGATVMTHALFIHLLPRVKFMASRSSKREDLED